MQLTVSSETLRKVNSLPAEKRAKVSETALFDSGRIIFIVGGQRLEYHI